MRLVGVKHGLITVQLVPDDGRLLARACEAARDQLGEDADHIETLGAAFKGATIAALAQWNMRQSDLRMLEADLSSVGWG